MALADRSGHCGFGFWYQKARQYCKDLGSAVKGFKDGIKDGETPAAKSEDKPVETDKR
jgi:sec-independent protein translocase protein TatA